MKKYILLFSLVFPISIFSQQWERQNLPLRPPIEDYDTRQILFIDDYTGFILINKEIWKTSDGGNNIFEIYEVPDNNNVIEMFFLEDTLIIVEGDRLTKSGNLGEDFFSIHFNSYSPSAAFFISSKRGWVFNESNEFMVTSNGGYTWSRGSIPNMSPLKDVFFTDSLNGFITKATYNSTNLILRTTTGGLTWSWQNVGPGLSNASVQFINDQIGIVSGTWGSYITYNGGDQWNPMSNLIGTELVIKHNIIMSHFRYPGNNPKKIFVSRDTAKTWDTLFCEFKTAAEIINDSTFVTGFWGGSIYKTTNNAEDWECLTQFTGSLSSGHFINQSTGWLAGSSLLKTTDAGISWEYIFIKYGGITSVFFLNSQKGFAIAPTGAIYSLIKTENSGKNWETIHNFDERVKEITFYDSLFGYGIGDNTFFFTTDGGDTWDFSNPQGVYGNDIDFPTRHTGFIVSSNALKTTDGGMSWLNLPGINSAFYISFIDSLNGWAAKDFHLLKTTNGGLSFDTVNTCWQYYCEKELYFFDELNGVLYSHTFPGVALTKDGGVTSYSGIYSPYFPGLTGFAFFSKNLGWAFGERGVIYKFSNDIIPVDLVSFTVSTNKNSVYLNWKTLTEKNNHGFEIHRKLDSSEEDAWISIGFVESRGTSTEPQQYSFIDENVETGKLRYRLKQINLDGSFELSEEIEVEMNTLPVRFELYQNYPNPFNPSTTIKFNVEKETDVTVIVYDVLGREIKNLVKDVKVPGQYEILFDGSDLVSGVYFYHIKAGSYSKVKKMQLIK